MLFGVGMIVGPSIGGVLFEYGGFCCPFFVVGVTIFAATLFAFVVLPKPSECNYFTMLEALTCIDVVIQNRCRRTRKRCLLCP